MGDLGLSFSLFHAHLILARSHSHILLEMLVEIAFIGNTHHFMHHCGRYARFADKEAERVDEEIFYYTSESDLKLPDNELVAILSESNPDWFD